jgi:uncharacterized protein YjbJ (UPF0337 family)
MATIQMLPRVLPNLGEKAVGLTKEFWGTVLDRDDLREAGQAQQKKADERIEEFRRELKADAKRVQASADETRQKAFQGKSARSNGKSDLEKTGPQSAASATAEKVKGAVKEGVGSIVGNQDLRREGSAQQDKAASEKDVAKEEAKAEQSRAKANTAERAQRAAEA